MLLVITEKASHKPELLQATAKITPIPASKAAQKNQLARSPRAKNRPGSPSRASFTTPKSIINLLKITIYCEDILPLSPK
jgi:hypothetical protein